MFLPILLPIKENKVKIFFNLPKPMSIKLTYKKPKQKSKHNHQNPSPTA